MKTLIKASLFFALLILTGCGNDDNKGMVPEFFNLIKIANNAVDVDLLPVYS